MFSIIYKWSKLSVFRMVTLIFVNEYGVLILLLYGSLVVSLAMFEPVGYRFVVLLSYFDWFFPLMLQLPSLVGQMQTVNNFNEEEN